jgi:hypothetical protein
LNSDTYLDPDGFTGISGDFSLIAAGRSARKNLIFPKRYKGLDENPFKIYCSFQLWTPRANSFFPLFAKGRISSLEGKEVSGDWGA